MPDKKTNERLTDFGYQTIPEEEKESHVKEVFDEVAPKYDIMNDVLSFGMHRLWKKYTVDKAAVKPRHECTRHCRRNRRSLNCYGR